MRVLALVTDGFGASGGIAQYNQNLAAALVQAGPARQVTLVPRYGGGDGQVPAGVEQIEAVAGDVGWTVNAMRLALRGFDIMFCGHLYAAPLAATLAVLAGKPLWLQAHGIEAWRAPSRAVRWAVESAQLVTVVSRYTRRRLLAWANIDPALVRVLPNTFSPSWTARPKAQAAQQDLRARHGLVGKHVILTVSRLSAAEAYKGHDRVIAAMLEIIRRHDAAYLIVGEGDDVVRLRALAENFQVADRVRFAGHVPSSELSQYFALADVFAMPSTGEGFGIALIEAAACGLPVIGGNGDGSVDALADGRIGQMIDPHDRDELIEAIISALEQRAPPDPSQVQRFAFANFCRHVNSLVEELGCDSVVI